MKRLIITLFCILLTLSAAAGCSAYAPKEGSMPTTTATFDDRESGAAPDLPAIQRKVLKNISLSLEAQNVAETYEQILAFAEERGGYEFSRSQQLADDKITITARIKIRPDALDDFIAYIGSLCRIILNQTTSEDITADYYDARTRLATMERALETYFGFLDSARTIEDSLRVQAQINDLTLRIESLKGQIRLWDSLLAESTVYIELRQISDPMTARREINWSTLSLDDMGYLMKAGLATLLNGLIVVLQWILIVLVVLSPFIVIALIVIILVRRKRRIRQKQLKERERALRADSAKDEKN